MTEWQTAATKRIVGEQLAAKQERIAKIEDYDSADRITSNEGE